MKNKKAYISIEAAIAVLAIMTVLSIIVSLFGFMVPRMFVEEEVQLLSQMVRVNGGLTQAQHEQAMISLGAHGDLLHISVFPSGREGNSLIGVAPRGTPHSICTDPLSHRPFARRDNGERIVIRVSLRLRAQGLSAFLDSVGVTALNDTFDVHKIVLSERNQC